LLIIALKVLDIGTGDTVQRRLRTAGISSGIHYPIPLHLQPAYKYKAHTKGDFPVAEKLSEEILSLPF